ncbi:MAG: four helix bundle protein [Chitinophagaceae bacterium]
MATITRFEDPDVWKLARSYYQKISPIAGQLRQQHEFRFAEQIKSAAGSIMDNIAEGFSRNSRLEFLQSLSIAKGECGESRSQVYRLFDDNYITEETYSELLKDSGHLSGKIANFVKYLNSTAIKGLKYKDRKQ